MDLIQTQSEKLIKLSESLESWRSCEYGKVLRMINSETLHSLRDIWSKYTISKREAYPDHQNRIENVLREHCNFEKDPRFFAIPLVRAFGIHAIYSTAISNHIMKQFWTTGVADIEDTPKDPIVNPLFLYTATARDKFAVNHQTHPLSVFHLVTAIPDWYIAMESSNSIYVENDLDKVVEHVVAAAKSQFRAWCIAFQEVTKASIPRVLIRFVAADPTAFCLALQYRNSGICTPNRRQYLQLCGLGLH